MGKFICLFLKILWCYIKEYKNIDFTLLSNNEIISIFQSIFSNILENFEVKEMYRMCKDTKLNISNNNAVILNNYTKQYFINTGKKQMI